MGHFHSRHSSTENDMAVDFVFREASGRVSVEWLIKDFCSLPKERGYILNSPSFLVSNAKWYIRMYPNEPSHVLIGLRRTFPINDKHQISYEFKFKDEDDLLVSSQVQEYEFKTDLNTSPMLLMNKFAMYHSSVYFRRNFNLTIVCNISINEAVGAAPTIETKDAESLNKNTVPKMTKGIETLLQNVKDLFLSEKEADVTIKVESKEFKVHRAILIARSPVFASMFHHDMMEKTSGIIIIEDCDPDGFNDFLRYMYTGKLDEVSSGNMSKLYMMASKYDMPELRDEAAYFMNRNMSLDSFCDVAAIASMYNDSDLLESVANFFIHNFKKIIRTEKWDNFLIDHSLFVNEMYQKIGI